MAFLTDQKKSLYPDTVFAPQEIIPGSLLFAVTTNAGTVEGDAPYVRIPYIADDPAVGFVDEGAEIPEEEGKLSELLVSTKKVAILSRLSREAVEAGNAADYVSASMQRAVNHKVDAALLTNAANPAGLLATPDMVDGGQMDANNLDSLIDAIATIEGNGASANFIVMDPTGWAAVEKLKAAEASNQPLIGAPADRTARQLLGLPVQVSPQMAAGQVLVGDSSNIVSSSGNLELTVSDQAFFTSDSIGYRVVFRFGFGVIRPDRLAKLSFAGDSGEE